MKTASIWSLTLDLYVLGIAIGSSFGDEIPVVYTHPEQIHISYGGSIDKIYVTWVTFNYTPSSVQYGVNGLQAIENGSTTKFVDGGSEHRVLFIHRVLLTDLIPDTKYWYHCGSIIDGWSELYFFKTFKSGSNWSPKLAIYGDMGNKGAYALPYIQQEAQMGNIDAILHIGDLAYDFYYDNARLGDEFMRQIQSIAAYVPYMTSPGNHEYQYNFSNYRNRFTMPGGDGEGLFYSWDVGPVHFLSFSSEVYYYYKSQTTIQRQLQFIEKDLIEANKPENREARPWIIVVAHKPMYCADRADIDLICLNPLNPVRVNGIEDLLYKYGVDMYFAGHEHNYERMWPVYNLKICNGSYDAPYTNPKATVHMVTGSAGMYSGKDPFIKEKLPWDAFRSMDFGYTKMTVQNSTHLYIEQISADKKGAVIDTMTLIKTRHDPAMFDCQWD